MVKTMDSMGKSTISFEISLMLPEIEFIVLVLLVFVWIFVPEKTKEVLFWTPFFNPFSRKPVQK